MTQVVLRPFSHRNKEVVGICFAREPSLELAVRKLRGVRWSQTHRCWYLLLADGVEALIEKALEGKADVDRQALEQYKTKRREVGMTSNGGKEARVKHPSQSRAWNLSAHNRSALQALVQQLKLKAYSASTLKTYRNEFMQLLLILKERKVDELTPDDLRSYLVYCLEKLKLSENTLHSRINALKFYFESVLGKEKFFFEIPRPKKALQVPRFFSADEVARIMRAVSNVKHRTMLMLAYGAGLRVSEVVGLRTADIDGQRRCLLVRRAKGKKDRMVGLSPVMLVMLRDYWRQYRPPLDGYFFEGQRQGERYSTRSLQLVVTAAKRKAGVLKGGSVHALRHSFATHLLDKGTDVTMIMKLLGHNDIKTTLRYLHTTNRDLMGISSPFDDLDLG